MSNNVVAVQSVELNLCCLQKTREVDLYEYNHK